MALDSSSPSQGCWPRPRFRPSPTSSDSCGQLQAILPLALPTVKSCYTAEIHLNGDQVTSLSFVRLSFSDDWGKSPKLSSKLWKRRNPSSWIRGVAVRWSGNFYQRESRKGDGKTERDTQAEGRAKARAIKLGLCDSGFNFLQGTFGSQPSQPLIKKERCHPVPRLPCPVSRRHPGTSCSQRVCWLQSPALCEPPTCIVEVEDCVPSGFEVSSREKEGTSVISLSNYFHYKKFPYLFFPFLKWHWGNAYQPAMNRGCTFQTVAKTKNRKAWLAQDVYNFLSRFLSPPPWASTQKWYMLNSFVCLQQHQKHQKSDKPVYSAYSVDVSRKFLLPRQRMTDSINQSTNIIQISLNEIQTMDDIGIWTMTQPSAHF